MESPGVAEVPAGHRLGRVVRVDRGSAVVSADGRDAVVRSRASEQLAVGDWVLLDQVGAIAEVLPRRTEIRRAEASGRSAEQVLAANVDVVVVCVPLQVDPRLGRMERLLGVAWGSGAQPVVVATKADLCPDRSAALASLAAAAIGVDVLAVTRDEPSSLAPLRELLSSGRTAVLLGASGVGKSSLVNALMEREAVATGAVRDDGKGRHTTTWRELVALPGGGALIDTPGLRAVGVGASDDVLATVFADVDELGADCRYDDCAHVSEPGCAVLAAVDDGVLDAGRLERMRKMQREAEWLDSRTDARLRAERSRRWKIISKAQRAHGH